MKRGCAICKTEFDAPTHRTRMCSPSCVRESRNRRKRKDYCPRTAACVECGNEFTVHGNTAMCSPKCKAVRASRRRKQWLRTRPKSPPPTQSELREMLDYCPITGDLTWKSHPSRQGQRFVGKPAGAFNDAVGRMCIQIKGRTYVASRVIFCWMTGRWPSGMIDHQNRDPSFDAWHNLREATRQQNSYNVGTRNPLGKGVRRRSDSCFQARIRADGRLITIGSYPTAELAAEAYADAAERYCGEFTCIEPARRALSP